MVDHAVDYPEERPAAHGDPVPLHKIALVSRPVRLALLTAVILGLSAPAAAAAGGYAHCAPPAGAALEFVARTGCADVAAVAVTVAADPVSDIGAALRAAGWSPLRALPAAGGMFDLVALRGRSVLRLRLRGTAPDLDGWAAGRELVFAPTRLVGGKPIPDGGAFCTSSFLVVWHKHLSGLSAGHCGGLRRKGSVVRPFLALRRPPQPGIPLGRVSTILARTAPYDALLAPVPTGPTRPAAPIVDRGIARPPWIVAGFARPKTGLPVCFTGRTSGADRCGKVVSGAGTQLSAFFQLGVLVICTDIRAREGDSGGPVYTPGRSDGTVDGVGLVTLAAGSNGRMCFTPLGPVLNRLGAALAVR